MTIEYKTYAKCLKVLSDETRLEIMDLLSEGEMCACALLDQFSITQPTLSYHMKMMKDCGLVDSRKDGIWVKYSVNHEKLIKKGLTHSYSLVIIYINFKIKSH